MKSKKLIEMIQEADPTGEGEFCMGGDCGNTDIYSIERKAGYWDGPYEVMVRDYTKTGCNVVGAQYRSDGQKFVLQPMSIEDALYGDKDLPVEVYDVSVKPSMADQVSRWRSEARECEETLIAPIFMKLMAKIKEGHVILQDKNDRGRKFFTLHWDKVKFNKYGCPENGLYSGECSVVFDSGFFCPVEEGNKDYIQWKLFI